MMDIFDTTTTDIPIYDEMLAGKRDTDYGKKITFEIVEMSGEEYLQKVAELNGSTFENQLRMLVDWNIDELEEVVNRGEKLPLPFIHYVAKAQEGRHRAMVAIRKKVPMKVMIIREAVVN